MNKQILKNKLTALEQKPLEGLIIRFLASWVLTGFFGLVLWQSSPVSVASTAKASPILVGGLLIVLFILLFVADTFIKKFCMSKIILPVALALYTGVHAFVAGDYYYIFGITAAWALLFYYYASRGWLYLNKPFTKKKTVIFSVVAIVFFMLIVGLTGAFRYWSYSAPNYDFGIFAHIFRNMKESFQPVSTCERDELLSHFSVHVSPVLYLLLPFYFIAPSPATLQISQAVILLSASVPLFLLAKKYSFSDFKAFLLSVTLVLFPATAQGMNYDFHENCFLLPLLLWVFYFFEKENYILMAVFSLLTLTVKEDAAVYLIFLALYIIVSRRKYAVGAVLFLGAAVYFGISLIFLTKYGNGVMSTRYENFIVGTGGLAQAVKNVLANPSYVFSQLFTDRQNDPAAKVLYVLQMLVPLAFIPFTGKKLSRYLLLLPMLLINIMTTYPYQFDIGFQYSFGSSAFLFYLCVLNLSEAKPETLKWQQCTAFVSCALCFISFCLPRNLHYFTELGSNRAVYRAMNEYLSEIPEDKSVIASTFLVPHLVDRDEIYEVEYHQNENREKCDYVIFDMRYDYKDLIKTYEDLGYRKTDTLEVNGTVYLVVLQP